jgi:uncharacterized BrkB/YihY/UPF0761 family membrane protein
MSQVSQCIRPDDPVFLAALVTGLVVSVLLGILLARFERTLQDHSVMNLRRHVAWLVALGVSFVGPIVLTALLDSWQHPERTVCTSLVWRWYFLPPVVLFVTGAIFGVLEARRRANGPGQASRPGA